MQVDGVLPPRIVAVMRVIVMVDSCVLRHGGNAMRHHAGCRHEGIEFLCFAVTEILLNVPHAL